MDKIVKELVIKTARKLFYAKQKASIRAKKLDVLAFREWEDLSLDEKLTYARPIYELMK